MSARDSYPTLAEFEQTPSAFSGEVRHALDEIDGLRAWIDDHPAAFIQAWNEEAARDDARQTVVTPPRSEWAPRATGEDERAPAYTDSAGGEYWWCNEVCREPHRAGGVAVRIPDDSEW